MLQPLYLCRLSRGTSNQLRMGVPAGIVHALQLTHHDIMAVRLTTNGGILLEKIPPRPLAVIDRSAPL